MLGYQFSSVTQLCPILCDPMDSSSQTSLSITNSRSLLKLMSIESVMPSNHLILCHPLLLLPLIFPSIRIFSNESILRIRWPKYWSFSFSISPSSEYSGLISFRMDYRKIIFLYQKSLNWKSLNKGCYLEKFKINSHLSEMDGLTFRAILELLTSIGPSTSGLSLRTPVLNSSSLPGFVIIHHN